MFIQMPILIGLYQVIQKPISYLVGVDWMQQEVIDKVYMLRDAMAPYIGNLAQQTEEALANMSQMQLSQWAGIVNGATDPWVINFNFLGMNLANTPSAALSYLMRFDFSNPGVIALLIIPILAVVSQMLTTKLTQIQSGQSKTNSDDQNPANQMTKSMMWMMPLMTGFFTFTLPSGIGIYWIISSITQMIQQLVLNKYFDNKGEEIIIKTPERKQLHGKKSKKR